MAKQNKNGKAEKTLNIDGYLVPESKAKGYIAVREAYAAKATSIFEKFCAKVSREWEGSEDGAAIVGYNKQDEIVVMIHLDPHDLNAMQKADIKGELEAFLKHSSMNHFSYQGKNCYYAEKGEGDVLLLLHGNTASSNMFLSVADTYAKDFKVVLFDFLGHGKSDRLESFPEDFWFDEAQQIIAFLKYKKYSNVNIIGTSGGAIAAINVGLEAPELVKNVVADSFEGKEPLLDFVGNIEYEREKSKQIIQAVAFFKAMHGDDWEKVVDNDTSAICRHAKNNGKFFHKPLSQFQPRLLLTASLKDELAPTGFYEKTYETILKETGHGKAHYFEDGFHPAMISNADAFYKLCLDFLKG